MTYFKRYKAHFIVVLAFLLFTYLYFPILFNGFFTHVETNDGRLVAALLSWDIHKILTDPFHIFQANFFYPNKNTLVYTEHFIGTSLLGLPVWLITGGNPAATFNFVMIFGYISNAYFTFLLIRELIHKNSIAFLGAFINGYCSYRLFSVAHLQDVIIFYIPLCLLFFYKYLDNKKIKYLAGIGFCLFFQSLSSWYHMIFIFLMLSLFVVFYYQVDKRINNKDFIRIISVYVIIFILIVPFAIPYLKHNAEVNAAYSMSDVIPSDFGGYFIPSPFTAANYFFRNYLGIFKTKWDENFNFIGYTVLLLASLGFMEISQDEYNKTRFRLNQQRFVFLFVGIIFFILSLGPFFFINDQQTHVKLPYYFIFRFLPPIRFLRTISRYGTVVFLMMSILASYGFSTYLTNIKDALYRNILFLFSFLLIMIEYTPILRFERFSDMEKTPEVYNKIKSDSTIKALVELPIDVGPFTTTKYLYYAGIHFKPIMNGYSGYEPPSYAGYRTLLKYPINEMTASFLSKLGITDILCNPEYKEPVDTNLLRLTIDKDGYRLYKIRRKSLPSMYVENMRQQEPTVQLTDTSLSITRQSEGAVFYPASEYVTIGYISPEKLNQWSSMTYTSNKGLDYLYIQFRTYTPQDTLQIECSRKDLHGKDSLLKIYTFVNYNEFNEKYTSLPLFKAEKIKFRLYSTFYIDRTFIRNLSFIKQ